MSEFKHTEAKSYCWNLRIFPKGGGNTSTWNGVVSELGAHEML